jgi:NADP-dependent 3-hydroxy acid dehydrogenase YdfG
MLKVRRGQIVFINSSSGLTAKPNSAPYNATKHALKAIADSLRAEVNAFGVRVISVYLGRTASEMQERIHRAEGKPYRPELLLQPEDVAAVIMNALALPRTAEVTDIHIRPMNKT